MTKKAILRILLVFFIFYLSIGIWVHSQMYSAVPIHLCNGLPGAMATQSMEENCQRQSPPTTDTSVLQKGYLIFTWPFAIIVASYHPT